MPPRPMIRRMPARRAAPRSSAPRRAVAPARPVFGRAMPQASPVGRPLFGRPMPRNARAFAPAASAMLRGAGKFANASAYMARLPHELEGVWRERNWEDSLGKKEAEERLSAVLKEANKSIARGTPEAFEHAEQIIYELVAGGRIEDAKVVIKFLEKELMRKGHTADAFSWRYLLENPKEFGEALEQMLEQRMPITGARQLEFLVRQMKGH